MGNIQKKIYIDEYTIALRKMLIKQQNLITVQYTISYSAKNSYWITYIIYYNII